MRQNDLMHFTHTLVYSQTQVGYYVWTHTIFISIIRKFISVCKFCICCRFAHIHILLLLLLHFYFILFYIYQVLRKSRLLYTDTIMYLETKMMILSFEDKLSVDSYYKLLKIFCQTGNKSGDTIQFSRNQTTLTHEQIRNHCKRKFVQLYSYQYFIFKYSCYKFGPISHIESRHFNLNKKNVAICNSL